MGQSKRKKGHHPPSPRKKKQGPRSQDSSDSLKDEQHEFASQMEHSSEPEKKPSPQKKSRRPEREKKQEKAPEGAPEYIYLVKNPKSNETYYCGSDQMHEKGTFVVAPTRYGLDMAVVLGYVHSMMLSTTVKQLEELEGQITYVDVPIPCAGCEDCSCSDDADSGPQESAEDEQEDSIEQERQQLFADAIDQERRERNERLASIDRIERVADAYDIAQYEKNEQKAEEAFDVCRQKIEQHKLDMKLVAAHYMLCEDKVLFFFTADNRVDFRSLVKDLVSVFRMRIELRQIGVRDESRLLGGMAVCGRDYCCHGVTDRLNPVSIKMAKEQNLSLNSMKISGPCGRLLCCLSYEYDFYKEEKKKLPNTGSRLKIRDELLKISEVNILSKKYHLTASDGRLLIIPFEKVRYNTETGRWDVDKEYIEEVLSV
jgi:cell fate regulator YaaT (PSP1 superfamily)